MMLIKLGLKNNITSENWTPFINYDIKNVHTSETTEDDGTCIEFADEKTQEYQDLIEAQVAAAQEGKSATLADDDGEEIDIDDI